jgi:hypothetical protein
MRRLLLLASVGALAFTFSSFPSAHAVAPKPASTGSILAGVPHLAQMRAELKNAGGSLRPGASLPDVHADGGLPPIVVHDANGDAADPHGDVVIATSNKDEISATFTMTMATPEDPLDDPAWVDPNHLTLAAWVIDTNFDGSPDFIVIMARDPDGLVAALFNENSNGGPLCEGQPKYDGRLVVRLPSSCPNLHAYKWAAAMLYLDNEDDAPAYPNLSATTPSSRFGYFMVGADGHIYGFGNAPAFGGKVANATGMATIPSGTGAYVVDTAGHIFTRGTAHYHGGTPALQAGESITTMATTPDGGGYWLFSNKGRVFPFGNAVSHGDMSGKALNGPIVAAVASADGNGYYMVGSDGGIFTFGSAKFHGSEGSTRLNAPIVGIAPTADHQGYWLVGSDGGVYTFGSAKFKGSMGGTRLNAPVRGMVAFGQGYLLVAADGGAFNFSNFPFEGSLGGKHIPAPIIGIVEFLFGAA